MRGLLLAGLSLAIVSNAWAEPSSKIAWTPETLRLVKSGDPAHGKELAQTCAGCHNAASDSPNLDGQLATYLYRQLHDYKDGSRKDDIMAGMVQALSDRDMADLAVWYSKQTAMAAGSGGAEDPTGIAFKGDSQRMEPPCSSCHGTGGQGEPVDTPRLSGQKAAYLEKTLLAYKNGVRANDIFHRMRLIAEKLSEAEIKRLAEYYSNVR
jgi:cytochrome c553